MHSEYNLKPVATSSGPSAQTQHLLASAQTGPGPVSSRAGVPPSATGFLRDAPPGLSVGLSSCLGAGEAEEALEGGVRPCLQRLARLVRCLRHRRGEARGGAGQAPGMAALARAWAVARETVRGPELGAGLVGNQQATCLRRAGPWAFAGWAAAGATERGV